MRRTAAVATLCAVLAGCGVPGRSAPVVVGNAPKLEAPQDTAPAEPPGPNGARNGTELVQRYLQAAAFANGTGAEDHDRSVDVARGRVRAFFTDEGRQLWQQSTDELTVVQADVGQPTPVGGLHTQVTMHWRPIGRLTAQGWVEQTTLQPGSATFDLVQSPDGLRIASGAPPGLMLSADGLAQLYEVHPIYFWDSPGDRVLVPDLRYLPKWVAPAGRPTVVVNWLLGGPSPGLRPIVQGVPKGIEVNGNVAQDGPRRDSPLVVNLSANAASLQRRLQHLVNQLRWSLRPFTAPVQLQIESRQPDGIDGSSDAYLFSNPAVHPERISEPDRYCVVAGQIQPAELHTTHAPLPVIQSPVNAGVVTAAVNRNQLGALVRQVGPKQQLWLADPADRERTRYVATAVNARSISTPVWVSWPKSGVLVVADGNLLYVQAGGGQVADVTPAGYTGMVTAVAVAPDGWRAGLIAGAQTYLTTLTAIGDNLAVTAPRTLFTGLTQPVGVAWSRETELAVVGQGGAGSTLAEVTVDGATTYVPPLTNLAKLAVSRLVGYPLNPTTGADLTGVPGFLMIEADNRAWKVFAGQVDELFPKDRTGSAVCTAPFFVD